VEKCLALLYVIGAPAQRGAREVSRSAPLMQVNATKYKRAQSDFYFTHSSKSKKSSTPHLIVNCQDAKEGLLQMMSASYVLKKNIIIKCGENFDYCTLFPPVLTSMSKLKEKPFKRLT
jgi:hypothetical protein